MSVTPMWTEPWLSRLQPSGLPSHFLSSQPCLAKKGNTGPFRSASHPQSGDQQSPDRLWREAGPRPSCVNVFGFPAEPQA